MRIITIDIAQDGSIEVETSGYTGTACIEATRQLVGALGHEGDVVKKPEYWEPAVVATVQQGA